MSGKHVGRCHHITIFYVNEADKPVVMSPLTHRSGSSAALSPLTVLGESCHKLSEQQWSPAGSVHCHLLCCRR